MQLAELCCLTFKNIKFLPSLLDSSWPVAIRYVGCRFIDLAVFYRKSVAQLAGYVCVGDLLSQPQAACLANAMLETHND